MVVADVRPSSSGIYDVDHCHSIESSMEALDFCQRNLKTGGHFVCKFLRGRLDNQLYLEAESLFEKVRLMKDKVSLLDPNLQE